MKLNNDEITTLLRTNGEPASEFLNHFGNFLRYNKNAYEGFQTNARYATYVDNAAKNGTLPTTAKFIIDSNQSLAKHCEKFLTHGFETKTRYRP